MTRKSRSGIIEFVNHPYPANVLFAPNKKSWDHLMDSMGLDEPYPDSAGRCTVFDRRNYMLKIVITFTGTDTRSSNEVIGLMAHELVHVSQFLQEAAGKPFDNETEAYLMQAMLMWLIDSYTSAGRTFKDTP